MDTLRRLWISLNFRYCMSSAYLAQQRGEMLEAADFLTRASEWEREYLMCGRRLV
jgi:hypothetical protein